MIIRVNIIIIFNAIFFRTKMLMSVIKWYNPVVLSYFSLDIPHIKQKDIARLSKMVGKIEWFTI